ncbi:class I SAM-dependent methyltransferase [Candidatus Rariloculus sp.]|uniref:class I SAM-dependent methyltransferase n=1 Tax=Candidatus Rariloculus sp. TaxID=3101265 RepID=UPI003D143D24
MRLVTSFAAIAVGTLGLSVAGAQDSGAYMIPADTPANIRSAVESSARSDEQRARDAGRKPAEIMTLAGIGEGDNIIELASFGHYYTTMLVEAVGPDGHVDMVDMPWIEPFGGDPARAFDAAHDNATFHQVHYNEANLPSGVDAVLCVLFYHDLHRDNESDTVDTADMNARIFAALRPGGIYLIVDHKAEDGSGWRDGTTLHRIGVETIREEVAAAGFELVEDSDLLANPDDDHTVVVRDPAIRGNTDRAVLVFRKPEA